jgi:hypothetical protein
MTELEKLLDKIYWHADAQGTAQAQILSDFAEKDKRIAELEAQVEKLKCCGNCTSFMIDDHHVLYCENDVYPFPILGKCDRWEASHAATPLRRRGHE